LPSFISHDPRKTTGKKAGMERKQNKGVFGYTGEVFPEIDVCLKVKQTAQVGLF
jgi:hypothetical protein